jgi:hypothetical protein
MLAIVPKIRPSLEMLYLRWVQKTLDKNHQFCASSDCMMSKLCPDTGIYPGFQQMLRVSGVWDMPDYGFYDTEILDHMLEGWEYCQMLYEDKRPVDFIYLAVNPAFERLTDAKSVAGKKGSEILPRIQVDNPELADTTHSIAMVRSFASMILISIGWVIPARKWSTSKISKTSWRLPARRI